MKQTKAVSRLKEIKKFQKKSFDFYWITSIVMVIATKKLAIKLQKHKERQRLMRDMAFSLMRPFFKYKIRARKVSSSPARVVTSHGTHSPPAPQIGGTNIHTRV